MAKLNIFNNTTNNSLVVSQVSQTQLQASALPLFCPDTLQLNWYLLTQTLNSQNTIQISPVLTTGLSFYVYITDGSLNGTVYTQQITWVADASGLFWTAYLALNTSAIINAIEALGSGSAQAAGLACFIEAGYIDGNGNQTTTLSQTITIKPGLPTGAMAPVPPGLTAASVQFVVASTMPQQPTAGLPLLLKSAAGKVIQMLAVDNPDGSVSLQQTNL